jgi:hypothetical protein
LDTSYDLLLCALYYRSFVADRSDDDRIAAEFGTSPFTPTSLAPATVQAAENPFPIVTTQTGR